MFNKKESTMRKFTDEEINALTIVKRMFRENKSITEWPKECPKSAGDQSVGATLDSACILIDELLQHQGDDDVKSRVSAVMTSQDFSSKCREIQRLYRPLSDKLAEYKMQLALDIRCDYHLIIIPDGLFFGNGNGDEYDHGVSSEYLFDQGNALDESQNDLVTLLDGKEKILSFNQK